jgi:hypothetical protein
MEGVTNFIGGSLSPNANSSSSSHNSWFGPPQSKVCGCVVVCSFSWD